MSNWLQQTYKQDLIEYPYEHKGKSCDIRDTLSGGKVLIRCKESDTEYIVWKSQVKPRNPKAPTDFTEDILCPNCGQMTSNIENCPNCEKEIEPFRRNLSYE